MYNHVLSSLLPFLFCLSMSTCLIWCRRPALTSEKIFPGCLCLFFVETLTCLLLPMELTTFAQMSATAMAVVVVLLMASDMMIADVVISIAALTICRLSTFITYLPQMIQIILCYGAIIGGDLFITYLENISSDDNDVTDENVEKSEKFKLFTTSSEVHNRSSFQDDENLQDEKSPKRRKSRLPSFADFLNPSGDVRRRFSSISSIWTIPISRRTNPSGSLAGLLRNNHSFPSVNHPIVGVRRQSGRDSQRRVSLPSFYSPRSSLLEFQYAITIGDWSGLLNEADGLLADLQVDPSPTAVQSTVRAVRRLLQASNQAQMAQQNALAAAAGLSTYNHNARRASHHHNQYSNGVLAGSAGGSGCSSGRRKSTIGGIFYRSTEDDLLEAAKLNSPFMGHPESNYESNIRLRSGATVSARRLSATLWTTTTSATGMPTLVGEAGSEPCVKKNRPPPLHGLDGQSGVSGGAGGRRRSSLTKGFLLQSPQSQAHGQSNSATTPQSAHANLELTGDATDVREENETALERGKDGQKDNQQQINSSTIPDQQQQEESSNHLPGHPQLQKNDKFSKHNNQEHLKQSSNNLRSPNQQIYSSSPNADNCIGEIRDPMRDQQQLTTISASQTACNARGSSPESNSTYSSFAPSTISTSSFDHAQNHNVAISPLLQKLQNVGGGGLGRKDRKKSKDGKQEVTINDIASSSWKSGDDVFDLLKSAGVSQSVMEGPLIGSLNLWNYPIFKLEQVLPERILTATAFKIFDDCSLFEFYNIDLKKFVQFFAQLEDGYWKRNTYHTRTHAADVMQGVYYLTMNQVPCSGSRGDHRPRNLLGSDDESSSTVDTDSHFNSSGGHDHDKDTECTLGAIADNMSEMEHMSLLLAAAMHDYDHPGRTNAFLVDTQDPLAILYNDRSVLENHHAASSWKLLMKPENDFITEALDPIEFKRLRFLVLETILATDLKKHFDFLAQMRDKLTISAGAGGPVFNWENEADRIFYSQLAIKLADIGGPTKSFDIHSQWTKHICEEFYQQGDDEASRGMPVSMYMSRTNPQVAQLQESFITHMVGPLCELFEQASLIPNNRPEEELHMDKFENGASKMNSFTTAADALTSTGSTVPANAILTPKIRVTRTDTETLDTPDAGSVSTNLCRHSTGSNSGLMTESIIMRQIKSNLAYWQDVLAKEQQQQQQASSPRHHQQQHSPTQSNFTPLHEQVSEEEYHQANDENGGGVQQNCNFKQDAELSSAITTQQTIQRYSPENNSSSKPTRTLLPNGSIADNGNATTTNRKTVDHSSSNHDDTSTKYYSTHGANRDSTNSSCSTSSSHEAAGGTVSSLSSSAYGTGTVPRAHDSSKGDTNSQNPFNPKQNKQTPQQELTSITVSSVSVSSSTATSTENS